MAKKQPAPPLTVGDLERIAKERLEDAKALLAQKRYDGGIYLCGYAVEIALKARICKTLNWADFPSSKEHYRSFYTHNLDVLLNLSGVEAAIKSTLTAEWSAVVEWDPEVRYAAVGTAIEADLLTMIDASSRLLTALL